jgi:hypothetical protein
LGWVRSFYIIVFIRFLWAPRELMLVLIDIAMVLQAAARADLFRLI